ncbi:MAG: rhodanese-like domain-containing protein [Verrucomicrobiales bacterium]
MKPPDATVTEEVSTGELQALLDGGAVRLIDCREPDEYGLCRIEGATLIPLQQIPGEIDAVRGEGDRAVVIYCHHGIRSLNATQFLRAHGLADVFSLRGGIDAWSVDIDAEVPRY